MEDKICLVCKLVLTEEEIAAGQCECGALIGSELFENDDSENSEENSIDEVSVGEISVGRILRGIGILILILGTIGSLIIAGSFGFVVFIVAEIVTIVSGMMILGFSEIINLLQDIKDKL